MKYIANPVVVDAHRFTKVDTPDANGHRKANLTDGTEVILTAAMTVRHVPVPGDYLVKQDDGYLYVNPKEVFERKYSTKNFEGGDGFDFGMALNALKEGKRVCRQGWNGKGMWLSLSPGSKDLPAEKFWSPHNREFAEKNGGKADVLASITMKTADGKILMGWLASQTDMLAEDWMLI